MQKKIETINNLLPPSLTAKNNTTMAFSSNAPRFQEKILDEETYIGPGYYEQKSCFDKSRSRVGSRQMGTAASTQAALNPARSMQQIAVNQRATGLAASTGAYKKPGMHNPTPGPGHYSSPDLNHWFKKSYN